MRYEVASAEPKLWTSSQVADFLQVSLRWVEKQVALGKIPCVRLPGGRLVRFEPDAVRAWAREAGEQGAR